MSTTEPPVAPTSEPIDNNANSLNCCKNDNVENGEQSSQPIPRPVSPVEKCAICLGIPENRSYTDSCFHEFCFVCLVEWSKVKAECPLCKQKFKNIIHNIRSMGDFDEFKVKTPHPSSSGAASSSSLSTDLNSNRFGYDEHGHRFRYNSTMTAERMELIRHIRELQTRLETLRHNQRSEFRLRRERERLQRLHRLYVRSALRPEAFTASLEFRRMVYERGMRVRPLNLDELGRRDISPEFYLQNPAQVHRLLRWLNRELNVFFNGRFERINFVCEFICHLVTRCEIGSAEFSRRLGVLLLQNTEHFVHEFLHFAQSPFEMDEYDRRIGYERAQQTADVAIVAATPSGSEAASRPGRANSNNSDGDVLIDMASVMSTPNNINTSTRSLVSQRPEEIFLGGSSPPVSLDVEDISGVSETDDHASIHSPELGRLTSVLSNRLADLRQSVQFTRARLNLLQNGFISTGALSTPGQEALPMSSSVATADFFSPLSTTSSLANYISNRYLRSSHNNGNVDDAIMIEDGEVAEFDEPIIDSIGPGQLVVNSSDEEGSHDNEGPSTSFGARYAMPSPWKRLKKQLQPVRRLRSISDRTQETMSSRGEGVEPTTDTDRALIEEDIERMSEHSTVSTIESIDFCIEDEEHYSIEHEVPSQNEQTESMSRKSRSSCSNHTSLSSDIEILAELKPKRFRTPELFDVGSSSENNATDLEDEKSKPATLKMNMHSPSQKINRQANYSDEENVPGCSYSNNRNAFRNMMPPRDDSRRHHHKRKRRSRTRSRDRSDSLVVQRVWDSADSTARRYVRDKSIDTITNEQRRYQRSSARSDRSTRSRSSRQERHSRRHDSSSNSDRRSGSTRHREYEHKSRDRHRILSSLSASDSDHEENERNQKRKHRRHH